MTRRRSFLFLAGLALLVQGVTAAFGQAATPTTTQAGKASASAAQGTPVADPVMPKDPNALMHLAARVNGLAAVGMPPWHLKANYQTFDADGKPKDQGVFEEWWAGPDKYTISYADPDFHQIEYRNGDTTQTLGDKGWSTLARDMVREYLNNPLENSPSGPKTDYVINDRKLGKVNLKCVELKSDSEGLSYCFDPEVPKIRLEQSGFLSVLFNRTARANGHYVAEQIQAENGDLPIVKFDVVLLEALSSLDKAMFVADSAAVPSPGPMVRASVLAGNRIGGEDVHYPSVARRERVQGMVILAATINKTGDIEDLEIVSGPEDLRKACLDAVKTWKYKPYLMNGEPVDVRTQINVVFQLGK